MQLQEVSVNGKFLHKLGRKQMSHAYKLKSSNDFSTQNQLAMGELTHKLIYIFKHFNFINVEQSPLSRL